MNIPVSIIRELERLNKDESYWCVPREAAVFLYYLVSRLQPRVAVEIGTSIGYSSLWISSALTSDACLYTVESHAQRFALAQKHFADAAVTNIIQLKGHAPEIFSDYQFPGGIDFLFVDGVKKGTKSYFQAAFTQLNAGAIVVVDNVTSHWDVMSHFVDYLNAEKIDFVYHQSLGDGMIVVYL